MKILLTENQILNILTEASKESVLVNKLNYTEGDASDLVRLCGALSVWMGKKLYQKFYDTQKDRSENPYWETKRFLQGGGVVNFLRNDITGIMDYIRVELNSDITPIKELGFDEIKKESKEWHDHLQGSEGNINYEEQNEIIRDYRKGNGGYYWANLNTNDSNEECERMGHCGRTSNMNTIISLRENRKVGNYYINKSHITAAVGKTNGIIFQMKGQNNAKPSEKYHPYIVDLLINDKTIKGFGSEYDSPSDFKISDLKQEKIKSLYEKRPELFSDRKNQKLLMGMGLIDKVVDNLVFNYETAASDLGRIIDGDYMVTRYVDRRTGNRVAASMFEMILSGDISDMYNRYDGVDIDYLMTHYVDEENMNTIKKMLISRMGEDYDLTDVDYDSEEFEDIKDALIDSQNDAEGDDYYDKLYSTLKECLSKYGEIIQMDDEGVEVKVDLSNYLDSLDEGEEDELFERCDNDLKCIFIELLEDGTIDKPEFFIDDRWEPDADEDNFNEMLKYRLDEIL